MQKREEVSDAEQGEKRQTAREAAAGVKKIRSVRAGGKGGKAERQGSARDRSNPSSWLTFSSDPSNMC